MSFYRATETPELETTAWFHTPEPLTLAALRGRVVVLYAFQMLCQGCIEEALPQAQRVYEAFTPAGVAVIGLHTVFESHTRMDDGALVRFLGQSGYRFPVAVDAPGPLWMPRTMEKFGLQGTPSLILIDRQGRRRLQKLGHIPDEKLWPAIQALL